MGGIKNKRSLNSAYELNWNFRWLLLLFRVGKFPRWGGGTGGKKRDVNCFLHGFISTKHSSTALSSCVSTSPTRNCSNSSTTTCSFLSKKNTRRKVSIGSSWISVWISRLASSWWKRYSTRYLTLFNKCHKLNQHLATPNQHQKWLLELLDVRSINIKRSSIVLDCNEAGEKWDR